MIKSVGYESFIDHSYYDKLTNDASEMEDYDFIADHDFAAKKLVLHGDKAIEDAMENDPVNHPKHYAGAKGIEVIDVIENFTSDLNGIEATDTGNIIKYILRWKHKNGVEDLEKAQWYLNHLINKVKENNDEN